ncbi:hypothetical protein ACHAW5_000183 [Stephanodiscus triporus]|uniref:PRA1 family protein n=1 Tax=Stephanodiscus triporus TaxID=2934178 RepID=A0ABD3PD62_9STRA
MLLGGVWGRMPRQASHDRDGQQTPPQKYKSKNYLSKIMALIPDDNSSSASAPGGGGGVGNVAGAISALSSASANIKSAWEKSGASSALAAAQSNLPQGAQDAVIIAKSRIFNRQNLRSPTVFFGFGEETPFYLERVPSLLTSRVHHNLSFFYLNYALTTGVLFALTLLISPTAIVGIGLLGFAWLALIRSTSEGSVKVKGITVTQKQATVAMSVLSVVVLIWLLQHIFWMTIGTSGFLCGVHCLLRDASMHRDESDRVIMQGDLSLDEMHGHDEAQFLNTPSAGSMA